jgi:molybdenum cofactor synthesis domain-containing protein
MKDTVPHEHKSHAPASVGCFVLTISDSKTSETDTSGALIRELLTGAGHRVTGHAIVRDEPAQVAAVIRSGCAAPSVEAFILTGGTGITSRDSTYEAIDALLDKRLAGVFRAGPRYDGDRAGNPLAGRVDSVVQKHFLRPIPTHRRTRKRPCTQNEPGNNVFLTVTLELVKHSSLERLPCRTRPILRHRQTLEIHRLHNRLAKRLPAGRLSPPNRFREFRPGD